MFTRSTDITISWTIKRCIITSTTCGTWNFSSFTICTDFTWDWSNSWITALTTSWTYVTICFTSSISIISSTTWWTWYLTVLIICCPLLARSRCCTSISTIMTWWTYYAFRWTTTSIIITKWTSITCCLLNTTKCAYEKRNN